MKKVISRLLISTVISGFALINNSLANSLQSNFISVIANVQISGAVKKPGVYKVPSGTRLVDVLVKAGGLKKDAVTTSLNLTTPVTDGTTFFIASKKDLEVKPEVVYKVENIKLVSEKKVRKSSREQNIKIQKHSTMQINLNTATQEELDSLPGIGEGLAKRIINYRTKNGLFKNLAEFNNVPGIGDKKIEKLKNKIIL